MIYHEQIRKYIIVMGKLFTNITIHRKNSEGELVQSIDVPFTYAAKQKYYIWLKQGLKVRPISQLVPRICYVLTSIDYDVNTKTNQLNQFYRKNEDPDKISYMYVPIPFLFNFSVAVIAKNKDDMFQIVEQIFTKFKPTKTLKIVETFNIERNIFVDMSDNSYDLQYELTEDANSLRVNIWNFNFVLRGYLYNQEKEYPVIKKVIVNVKGYDGNDIDNEKIFYIEENEVDPFESEIDDEWDIKKTITEY